MYSCSDPDLSNFVTKEELEELEKLSAPMISVTYNDLKSLRDDSKLIPGQQYRITDYVTTTTQENTRSAGHQFDIIVTADDEKTLNEAARACMHEGDTYFSEAGAKLEAWQIWYSLDNDTERFAWADSENGKGVIYRMIDEWGNDCPYDFKNIQFKRFAVTAYDKVPSLVVDNEENHYGYYYGALRLSGSQVIHEATYGEDFVWVHTFALKDLATETWHDYTILNSIGLKTDESVIITCHSNVIKEYRDEYLGEHGRKTIWLNNIVFFNCYADISSPDYSFYYSDSYSNSFENDCESNTFGDDCRCNSFGDGCDANTFGVGCYSNSFGSYCRDNRFGNSCYFNSFGTNCYFNRFGDGCTTNSFGNGCYSNTFGNNCYSNSFGYNCYDNTFGNNYDVNSFGNHCYDNSFGEGCSQNSFGNGCDGNTFGNNCHINSFGEGCSQNSFVNGCSSNSFGNSCGDNTFGEDCHDNSFGEYCYENSFSDECHYNSFGNNCYNNTFGDECESNSFGNNCCRNSLGNNCDNNSFDNDCHDNSFGNYCQSNSFGNVCYNNSLGDNCFNNSFGNSCGGNSFGKFCEHNSFGNDCNINSFRLSPLTTSSLKNYCHYNHFDDGCYYNVIWNRDTTSSSKLLKNINVNRGVSGTSSKHNFININTIGSEQEINVNQVDGIVSIGDVLSIRYESLRYLRDNSQLIPGRQYRIIDYNTTTSQANTTSAGHPFDIIVTAIDEYRLSEEAQAAQNHNNDNGYFDESNLSAWKIWYSLDNDTDRFEWAGDERIETTTVETIVADSSECTIKSELIDGNTFITPFNFESCVWVDSDSDYADDTNNHDIDELIYEWDYFDNPKTGNTELCIYKSDADLYEEEGCADSGDKYVYRGLVTVDGEEYDYWQKYELNQDGEYNELDVNGNGYVFATTARIVSNPEAYSYETTTETIETVIPLEPKGVIYRMIDEFGNDLPYDFKNIMFVRYKLEAPEEYIAEGNDTLRMQQLYNNVRAMFNTGDRSFVWAGTTNKDKYWEDYKRQILSHTTGEKLAFFTFNTDKDIDASLSGSTHSNKLQLSHRLPNNVFFGDNCYNNTFGDGCHDNSLGGACCDNSFGTNCYNNSFYIECGHNSFGNNCYNNSCGGSYYNNSFGDDCSTNAFGNSCYSNTFGNSCYSNTFGDDSGSNSFGDDCHSNSFGKNCNKNSFGKGFHDNNFGNNCSYNSFDNICSYNSFGNYCRYNSFGNSCSYNSFVEICDSNSFGNQCDDNSFGKSCTSNSFGNECHYNSFGNGCSDNSFSNNCHYNSFGNECYCNSLGDYCIYNIFGDRFTNNSFGNRCMYNSFRSSASQTASLKAYCEYNHFDDGCSYNVIWTSHTTSSSKLLKNINFNRGVRGTSSNYNFINIDTLNADYEIQVAKNSKGEIKIYCEADLIA